MAKYRRHRSKHAYNLSYPYSFRHKSRKQKGGFLSRYDFAYAGRDSVIQAAYHAKKIAPKLTDQTFDRARDLAPNVI